ncbi:hypothetical protein ACQEVY_01150 [Streptomyces sp. CA-288835]|uniref:hypothetical protein n=1 Tax=Streptomyces sp. CA-288835 TaxID=3240069 RepID=UPI003D8AD017
MTHRYWLKIDGWGIPVEEVAFESVSREELDPPHPLKRKWNINQVYTWSMSTGRSPAQVSRTALTVVAMRAPYDDGPPLHQLLTELGARAEDDLTLEDITLREHAHQHEQERQQHLDSLIDLGNGESKRLKECTAEDLRAATHREDGS